jgi:hypothetical protein
MRDLNFFKGTFAQEISGLFKTLHPQNIFFYLQKDSIENLFEFLYYICKD